MALHRKPSEPLAHALEYLNGIVSSAVDQGRKQLPSIRKLSEEAEVAPRTMRKALHALVSKGLVTVVNRGGVVVNAAAQAAETTPTADLHDITNETRAAGVRDRVAEDILAGVHMPGAPLPPLKELCRTYNCSYGTLRSALDSLTNDGVLQRQHRGYAVFSSGGSSSASTVAILKRSAGFHGPRHQRQFAMWRYIERCAVKHGLHVSIHGLRDAGDTALSRSRALAEFVKRQEDGNCLGYIAWIPASDEELVENVHAFVLPTEKSVCFLEETGGPTLERINHFRNAYPLFAWLPYSYTQRPGLEMARHLIPLGHRRVAWFGPGSDNSWEINRLMGLRQGFAGLGLHDAIVTFTGASQDFDTHDDTEEHDALVAELDAIRDHVRKHEWFVGEMQHRMLNLVDIATHVRLRRAFRPCFEKALRDSSITAWVGANDAIALAAMSFLKKEGLHLPRDMSVVGFDDSIDAVLTGLTSYSIDEERIAAAVVSHVLSPSRGRQRKGIVLDVPGVVMRRLSSGKAV